MAARNSGSKMVGLAVAATVTALGVGTIYLPFVADRDKVRGLHEESDMSAQEKREFDAMIQKMQQDAEARKSATGGAGNSMWSRIGGTGDRK